MFFAHKVLIHLISIFWLFVKLSIFGLSLELIFGFLVRSRLIIHILCGIESFWYVCAEMDLETVSNYIYISWCILLVIKKFHLGFWGRFFPSAVVLITNFLAYILCTNGIFLSVRCCSWDPMICKLLWINYDTTLEVSVFILNYPSTGGTHAVKFLRKLFEMLV